MRMTAFSKTAFANPYVRTGLIVALTALSMANPTFAQIAKLSISRRKAESPGTVG
ncbi:hypothetical protein [Asticcacaulis sp. W401b]|uniref:hypothetical protein n=1 Tax=Asticcacaulis sp. W401b TaxID=3388666 RepID=UPI003970B8B2